MRRTPRAAGLAVLAALAVACGGGDDPAPASEAEQDCGSVITAARGIRLVDPATATDADVTAVASAAARLNDAAEAATTAVADPARDLAETARHYAEALADDQVQRARTRQGLLRQQAAPIAEACGESAARILGTSL